MRIPRTKAVLMAFALCFGTVARGHGAVPELPVETVGNVWGVPFNVLVERTRHGLRVSGEVRKTPINPSRRLGGEVQVEVLDEAGHVLAVFHGRLWRGSVARHCSRAEFELEIDTLPQAGVALRVAYGQP